MGQETSFASFRGRLLRNACCVYARDFSDHSVKRAQVFKVEQTAESKKREADIAKIAGPSEAHTSRYAAS